MRKLLLSLFLGCSMYVAGQLTPQQSNQLEMLSEETENESLDLSNWSERLESLQNDPINLNNCSRSELRKIPFISNIQIESLFQHLTKNGRLMSIYELQSLAYWDIEFINQVLPYVTVVDRFENGHFTLSEALKYGKLESFSRAQWIPQGKKGYEEKYIGNPMKIYQ